MSCDGETRYRHSSMTRLRQLEKQIARLERRAKVLNQISSKYWTARRIIFIAGVLLALAFCNFAGTRIAWFVAAILLIIFSVVTFFHTKVRNSLKRNSLLIDIKHVQIARIRLDWDKIPPGDPLALPIPGHPFETDLDITGERSLHRLLDSAVTKEGSDRLKSWLLNPRPDMDLIKHRQALVEELRGHHVFRDKLQLLSAVARLDTGPRRAGASNLWNSSILVDWLARTERKKSLLAYGRVSVCAVGLEHHVHRAREPRGDSSDLAPHVTALHRFNAAVARQN